MVGIVLKKTAGDKFVLEKRKILTSLTATIMYALIRQMFSKQNLSSCSKQVSKFENNANCN